jgi:hypothetical protein
VNCEGHLQVLLRLFQDEDRLEFWTFMNLDTPSFSDLGLLPDSPDQLVWQRCQDERLVLLTGNRNAQGADSLEMVIRTLGTVHSLPVVTLADATRLLHDGIHARRAADKLLQILFEIDQHRGAGRLYIP